MTVKISIPASVLMAGSVGRQTIGSLGSSEDSTNASFKNASFNERHPKVVRSLTVVAYIFCVSLAAILLSMYYVVLWTPDSANAQKNQNLNKTFTPCGGVTNGPEGEMVGYHPQYGYRSRFKGSRFSYPVRSWSARRRVDSNNHLSLQQDSPYSSANDTASDVDETGERDTSSYEVTIDAPKSFSKPASTIAPTTFSSAKPRSVLFDKIVTSNRASMRMRPTTSVPMR